MHELTFFLHNNLTTCFEERMDGRNVDKDMLGIKFLSIVSMSTRWQVDTTNENQDVATG